MHTDINRTSTAPHQARRHVHAGRNKGDRVKHVDVDQARQDHGHDSAGGRKCTALRSDRPYAADDRERDAINYSRYASRSGMPREGAMFRTKQSRAMQDFNINIRTVREGVSVQEKTQKGQKRMKKLIRYSETPQVTALEYSELRDLKEHPEKKKHYENVVYQRLRMDARRK